MLKEWRPIEGFEGLYEVSNYGEVKALARLVPNNGGMQRKHERILTANSNSGHYVVVLSRGGKTYPRLVHRLVATAFVPNPRGKPFVDHIDTDTTNNRADNLRWVTAQENALNPLTRKHNSESKMGHPYYGRPLTNAERDKIRQSRLGKKASEDTRKRLSDSHKESSAAQNAARENLKKAVAANTGRECSEETREKIRNKLIGVHKGKSWKLENGKRVWYNKDE